MQQPLLVAVPSLVSAGLGKLASALAGHSAVPFPGSEKPAPSTPLQCACLTYSCKLACAPAAASLHVFRGVQPTIVTLPVASVRWPCMLPLFLRQCASSLDPAAPYMPFYSLKQFASSL